MAWTAPMTAVANAIFTASKFNTHVRDNLLETEPGIATTASSLLWSTGANAIAERIPNTATIATDESTTSTTFVDLTTVGPVVTADTGTTAMLFYSCGMYNSGVNNANEMSFDVTGATTIAASSADSVVLDGIAASNTCRFGAFTLKSGLTEGNNIFTAKYKVSAGTGNFLARELFVIPM